MKIGVSAFNPTSDEIFLTAFTQESKVLLGISVDSGTIVREFPTNFHTLDFDEQTGFLFGFAKLTVDQLTQFPNFRNFSISEKIINLSNSLHIIVLQKVDPTDGNSPQLVSVFDKYTEVFGSMSSIDVKSRKITAFLEYQDTVDLMTTNIDTGEQVDAVYSFCKAEECTYTSLVYISQ